MSSIKDIFLSWFNITKAEEIQTGISNNSEKYSMTVNLVQGSPYKFVIQKFEQKLGVWSIVNLSATDAHVILTAIFHVECVTTILIS